MPYTKVTLPDANLESIFSCTKQPIYVVGSNLKIIYANSHAIKLVGKSRLNNTHCYEIFHADKKQPANCPWKAPACNNVRLEKECICKNGKIENFCNIDALPVHDKSGKMIAALHMLEVTTEQLRLAEELLESNKELQLLNELSAILSQSLNLDEVLKAALKRLSQWSDLKSGAVYLAEDEILKMRVHEGVSEDFVKSMKTLPLGRGISGVAAKRKRVVISEDAAQDGRTKKSVLAKEKLKATVSIPIIFKDKASGVLTLASANARKFSGREVKLLESVADQMAVVIQNAKLYEKTITLSRTDNLTGLFNSRYFEEILHRQISLSRRKDHSFALMMLDLDNLKTINDVYGHDSGDLMLRSFSQLLRDNLRESDFFARYGGDEFVILLPDSDEKMAKNVANKIRRKVESTKVFGFDPKALMTVSIGIAMFPQAASTMISLIKAADIAMYRAKQGGKNAVCSFEPSLLPEIKFDHKRIERIASNADLNSIQTLVTAVDLKDRYTGGHSAEVSRLAVHLAKRIGLSRQETEHVRVAALLHDIGKIGISDNILLKPHRLSSNELDQIRKHPEMGVLILKYSKDFKKVLPIVLHHHEKWDGSGYPNGLQGEKIPLLARIVTIVDAYEAMTSNRPYRMGMSKNKALSQLRKFASIQFDPYLVEIFSGIINELDQKASSSQLSAVGYQQ